MQRKLHPFLTVSAAALLSSCGLSLPHLKAGTADELRTSLTRYVNAGSSESREARQAEAELLLQEYVVGDNFKDVAPHYPPIVALERLRYEDITEFVSRVKRIRDGEESLLLPPVTNPSEEIHQHWLKKHVLSQLKVQKDLLELNRERARWKDLFTVDQLSYREAAFIPPQEGMPYGRDHATFTVKFTNESFFNIYTVGFRVRVKEPAYTLPLIDDVLTFDTSKEPIKVGETRVIELKCCDSISSEVLNLSLKNLSASAEIDIDLARVTDFTKTDRLVNTYFSAEQNVKLVATAICIKDIEERLDTWTWADADPACIKY